MIASVSDLGTYLGPEDPINLPPAALILQLAEDRCRTLLDPLPPAAKGVVLDVAQRAYVNVTGAEAQGVGQFSVTMPSIGVSLTSANRRELRQMAGRGGAFTVDPTPADAGTVPPVWLPLP